MCTHHAQAIITYTTHVIRVNCEIIVSRMIINYYIHNVDVESKKAQLKILCFTILVEY